MLASSRAQGEGLWGGEGRGFVQHQRLRKKRFEGFVRGQGA